MPEAFSILSIPETTIGNLSKINSNTLSGKIPFWLASLIFMSGFNETCRELDKSNII